MTKLKIIIIKIVYLPIKKIIKIIKILDINYCC